MVEETNGNRDRQIMKKVLSGRQVQVQHNTNSAL